MNALHKMTDWEAQTILLDRLAKSVVRKGRSGRPLNGTEQALVTFVCKALGWDENELYKPATFADRVEAARHNVRDGAGRSAPAPPPPASQHHPMDGTADDELTITGLPNGLSIPTNMPWRHSGNTLLR